MADEAFVEVFVDVLLEDVEFYWRELIDRSEWWDRILLKGNRVVVGAMWRELVGFLLAEDSGEFMVFWGDCLEIGVFCGRTREDFLEGQEAEPDSGLV